MRNDAKIIKISTYSWFPDLLRNACRVFYEDYERNWRKAVLSHVHSEKTGRTAIGILDAIRTPTSRSSA